MKVLIYGGSCMKLSHSFIAPLRIARAYHRHGHEVRMINWADDRIPSSAIGAESDGLSWGHCYTLPLDRMISVFIEQIDGWKPDIVYAMGTTHIDTLIKLCKKYSIPIGLHVGDPYYASYPTQGIIDIYDKMSFITFNEGQAYNYVRTVYSYLADKCWLLNHAIDPELAPSENQLKLLEKKYICACVGGDDRIRRRELIQYYYQWTNSFSNHQFVVGGSLYKGFKGATYTTQDLDSKVNDGHQKWNHTTFTDEEVKLYTEKAFNIIHIPNDLPYPLGLSHPATHLLYAQSYYGFTPYGHYLREGSQSQYNMMTFGTKITEMGGSGAAMIANRIHDIDVLIKHGETGWILENPEDTLKAFKFAIEHPKDARQMGINAYKYIHKYHNWDLRYETVLVPIFRKLGYNNV